MANIVNTQSKLPVVNAVALAPGTYTTTNFYNLGHHGLNCYINMTNSNGGGLVVTLQGYDDASSTAFTLLASSSISTNVFTTLQVYPGIAVSASASILLPATWNIKYVITGGSNSTFTISVANLV